LRDYLQTSGSPARSPVREKIGVFASQTNLVCGAKIVEPNLGKVNGEKRLDGLR
jgi:hypothetical protein